MSIDNAMQDYQTDIFPPPVERKIKYDPSSKSLRAIINGRDYVRGDIYVYESPILIRVSKDFTNSTSLDDSVNLAAIISEYETSITKYKKTWESIPTVEDYFDLDTINDVDEVEHAFYQASEEFGW